MSGDLAVLPVPRPKTPANYDQRVTEQAFQAVERDLSEKHDKRGDLILPRGFNLVVSADDGSAQYGLGVNSAGRFRLIDYSTGIEGTFTVTWDQVDGAAAQITALTAAYQDADTSLQANIDTEASTRATADSANATSITTVGARVDLVESPNANLLVDGGFERGTDEWDLTGANGVVLQADGPYLIAAWAGLTFAARSSLFPVTANGTYTMSLETLSTSTSSSDLRADIEWWSATAIVGYGGNLNIGAGSNWERRSVTATAPATATQARIRFWFFNTSSSPVIRVRRVKFEAGSSVTPFSSEATAGSIGALTSILQEAFVDSSGNAIASINLVAAASGGDPATIELLSGDGVSGVRIGGNTEIDGNLVVTGTITSDAIGANEVTEPYSASAASVSMTADNTYDDLVSFSATLASGEAGILIQSSVNMYHYFLAGSGATQVTDVQVQLLRDTTVIAESIFNMSPLYDPNLFGRQPVAFTVFDTTVGTHTFKLRARMDGNTSGVQTARADYPSITGLRLKR